MTLTELQKGQTAIITQIGGEGHLRQHLLDMGLIPGAEVEIVKFAPMGDPIEIMIHGYELSLRKADAADITIKTDTEGEHDEAQTQAPKKEIPHPGLGESGPQYHDKKNEHPLPDGLKMNFALAGNQNCGKTTLFNQLTGMNQHVGNFPGVTVDHKEGEIKGYPNTTLVDLPGIYSLSPYTNEEIVSRQYILESDPKGIVNIVDANNIERNLYLTMQLIELNKPMVLALNMIDEVENNGGSIDVNLMEEMLGIPVVPVSALHNEGVDELIQHAMHVAKYQEAPKIQDFCKPEDHGGAMHRCLHSIMHLIEDHAAAAHLPIRFAASKLVEGDQRITAALKISENEKATIQHILEQLEEERGLDPAAAMAEMRFAFIEKITKACVVKPKKSKEYLRSQQIDQLLTGRWTAMPLFFGIMALIFWLTFDLIGGYLQNEVEVGVDLFANWAGDSLAFLQINKAIGGLVVNGIIGGVGTVITFLPVIVMLFFFLSLLEDSGYMARIAFIMDKPLRRLGLSGKSIVPLLIGFGCSVPSIMASRTLSSERDRKLTIRLIPFMSCTAKMPIYGFFCTFFFPQHSGLIIFGLYLIGVLTGIVVAVIMKKTVYKGEAIPFVMELPNYRIPSLRSVCFLVWDKVKDFVERAFTIICLATVIIWCLSSFNWHFNLTTDMSQSILADISGLLTPIFAPLGFGNWESITALVSGLLAKESVVSTLSVLYGDTGIAQAMNGLSAFCLMVFCLIYTPCAATIATVKHEMGGKYALNLVIFQCLVAWVVTFVVRMIGLLLL